MPPRPRVPTFALGTLAFVVCVAAHAGAQAVPAARRGCDGDTVTAIDIRTHPASSVGAKDDVWHATSTALASHFATSHADLIRAYLHIAVGQRCTEIDRTESERVLRAQPFIALASVRAVSDGRGHTRLTVDAVDEYPLIVTGGLNNGSLATLSLGTQNFRGRGLSATVTGTRGFAYRDGIGVQAVQYGAFGGPNYIAIGAARHPLGEAFSLEYANPFLTELQRKAFIAGVRESSDYFGVTIPGSDPLSLLTHRTSYDIGWVSRFRSRTRGQSVGFAGVAMMGEVSRVNADAKIVSDTGLVDVPDNAFLATYPMFDVVRVAAIGGVRALRFVTARGFDALAAQQDVGVGVQLNLLAAPSVWESQGGRDLFISTDAYAGAGDSSSFVALHYTGEARRNALSRRWDALVTNAKAVWYTRPSPERTNIVSLNVSAVRRLDFPAQLTFRDPDGGVPGYPDARAGAGARAVLRIEARHALPWFAPRANVAYSLMASAGKLWAGDVPYGLATAARASLGVALLAAVPAGSKHTYRAEFSVPLNRESGGSRYEIRLTWIDRTRLLWLEPRDVSRVRTGAVPSNLMKW